MKKLNMKSTPIGYAIPIVRPGNIHTSNSIQIEQVVLRNIYMHINIIIYL